MKTSLASLILAPLCWPRAAAFAGDDKPAPADGTAKPAKSFTENILKGDYLETRTCDIWTGPCFANSETSEAGREATLAWHFTSGKWAGVDLDGVSAVLVIEAQGDARRQVPLAAAGARRPAAGREGDRRAARGDAQTS